MIYSAFKKTVAAIVFLTPSFVVPAIGNWLTCGKVNKHDWAEIYLAARFLFAVSLSVLLPQSFALCCVVGFIQATSLLYLLSIVFPIDERQILNAGRSLFFALGHYLEIGLSMGYVYWCVGTFNDPEITTLKAIYFSFVTMFTVGYGEIYPTSDATRLLVIAQIIIGVFMLATVIGLFVSLASSSPAQVPNSNLTGAAGKPPGERKRTR